MLSGENGRMTSKVGIGKSVQIVAVLVALAGCAPAPFAGLRIEPRQADFNERMLIRTLPNGLRVVLVPDYRTNLVMVGVHYGVGASDDPIRGDGLAHYAEHEMFDAGFHGQGGDALRDVGLAANAFTSA